MPTSLSDYIALQTAQIEKRLDQLVPDRPVAHSTLFQAARYALLGGGKRLRPLLTLAVVEALGGKVEAALTPACALEMVHTYSLIHDDLPCMDNDDFRRGKPTVHKVYPEGQAVLAGDFLLTHAFRILVQAPEVSAHQKLKLIEILSHHAGGEGMIAGQVLDLESEGKQIDLDRLSLIHRCKTGAMLTASIEFGTVMAEVDGHQAEQLKQFGEEIGLAFQIVDDILDVTASQQKHGRSIASDVMNGKATYVSLLGMEPSQKMAQKLLDAALQRLDQFSGDMTILRQLAHLIVNRQF